MSKKDTILLEQAYGAVYEQNDQSWKYSEGDEFEYLGKTYRVYEIEKVSHNGLGPGYYVIDTSDGETEYITVGELDPNYNPLK